MKPRGGRKRDGNVHVGGDFKNPAVELIYLVVMFVFVMVMLVIQVERDRRNRR